MDIIKVSDEYISRASTIIPERCRFLYEASVSYFSGADLKKPILARDLSNGALTKEEFEPAIRFSGIFKGMRQSGVLTVPLDHLSGFHLQYMIPQLSFVGITQMIKDGRVPNIKSESSLDEVVRVMKEGFLTDLDLREFRNAHVALSDDTTIYGTAWLLNSIRPHLSSGGAVAQVKYTFGPTPENQPQIAYSRYGLGLGPLLRK